MTYKPFACDSCAKCFTTPGGRDQHFRDVHQGLAMPVSQTPKKKRRRYIGKRPPCPIHNVALVTFVGRFGSFFGCPQYPNCDITGSWSKHNGRFYLTTQADRDARKLAHATFDPLWETGHWNRQAAYAWLAEQLGIERIDCHMQHFDEATANRVVELCKAYVHEHGLADEFCAL